MRRLKESLSVLRSDMNAAGVDISFSPECLNEVLGSFWLYPTTIKVKLLVLISPLWNMLLVGD